MHLFVFIIKKYKQKLYNKNNIKHGYENTEYKKCIL